MDNKRIEKYAELAWEVEETSDKLLVKRTDKKWRTQFYFIFSSVCTVVLLLSFMRTESTIWKFVHILGFVVLWAKAIMETINVVVIDKTSQIIKIGYNRSYLSIELTDNVSFELKDIQLERNDGNWDDGVAFIMVVDERKFTLHRAYRTEVLELAEIQKAKTQIESFLNNIHAAG